jgi:sugar O-acyltransferase (sialic acid O-acetyltransferase NeuD family)
MSKVVLFGNGGWAQYLHYCLSHDSGHQVVGFTVDGEYLKESNLLGLPVVPFGEVRSAFPPSDHKMLVAVSYQRMNRLRAERYAQAKAMGYELVSYISSRAQVVPELQLGDNCLVLENCVVQPFVRIGNDVTICASAVVGHHTVIEDHAFVSPGAVILGVVTIGCRSLIGANATLYQAIKLGRECLVGMGVALNQDAKDGSVFVNPPAELMPQSSEELIPFLSWS